MTVFFGANDAALPDRGSQQQHVPISEYKENLHQIVSHIKVSPTALQSTILSCSSPRQWNHAATSIP